MLWDILVKASFKGFNSIFSILNCYGPYSNRDYFWNNVLAGGIFDPPNIILVGDLNFTISDAKIWGSKARIDTLAPFFSQLLTTTNMVDLAPLLALPGEMVVLVWKE